MVVATTAVPAPPSRLVASVVGATAAPNGHVSVYGVPPPDEPGPPVTTQVPGPASPCIAVVNADVDTLNASAAVVTPACETVNVPPVA